MANSHAALGDARTILSKNIPKSLYGSVFAGLGTWPALVFCRAMRTDVRHGTCNLQVQGIQGESFMLHRGFAVLGLLAISPAHATLIEYSFTSTIGGYGGTVGDDFGVEVGDSIKGGFVFDDAAPMTAHVEGEIVGTAGWATGVATASTYDMSGLQLWANVGDHLITATGDELFVGDAPDMVYNPDTWHLGAQGNGYSINGYIVDGIQIFLQEWFCGPLHDSALQVSDAAGWGYGGYGSFNRWFDIAFADGSFINGQMNSITPASVPEPATLSLLAAGALGAFAARRRKRSADAK